jgi:hypothetical protein
LKRVLIIFIYLICINATPANAQNFNISILPSKSPASPEKIKGLVVFSVYQTEKNQEAQIGNFSSYVGNCATCSKGIAFNCDFKAKDIPAQKIDICQKILKNGVAFVFQNNKDFGQISIKNLTGMTIAEKKHAEIIQEGIITNFILSPSPQEDRPLENIRLEVSVWPNRDQSEGNTQDFPVFQRNLPAFMAKVCQESAHILVDQVLIADSNLEPYLKKNGTTHVKFARANAWLGMPHEGTAIYFANVPMSDGWECSYRVDMAMHYGAVPVNRRCSLSSLHFRMCSK